MQAWDIADHPLNRYENLFAVTEVVHIVALTLSAGTIALVDFSLMGMGWKGQSPNDMERVTQMWTAGGVMAGIFSGLLLFSTDPLRYFFSPTFQLKMVLLTLAVLWNYTLHKWGIGRRAWWTGAVSTALWISVIFCGLFFAFMPGGY